MLVTSKKVLIGITGIVALYFLAELLESDDPDSDESFLGKLKLQIGVTLDTITGKERLTRAKINAAGVVLDSVDDLLAQAAAVVGYIVTADALTLSRAIASEADRDDETETSKLYRCHVLLNLAAKSGVSITVLALKHSTPSRNGHYGKQISGAFATSKDSYVDDLAIAQLAITQRAAGNDPTGGAIQFSDKHGFGGVQGGTPEWDEHVESRKSEGKIGANLPDAPKSLVFWYKGFLPSQAVKAV